MGIRILYFLLVRNVGRSAISGLPAMGNTAETAAKGNIVLVNINLQLIAYAHPANLWRARRHSVGRRFVGLDRVEGGNSFSIGAGPSMGSLTAGVRRRREFVRIRIRTRG